MKPEYKILDILNVFRDVCIMDFSAQYKIYSCASNEVHSNELLSNIANSYVEKYGLTIFCAFISLASPQTYMSHN